MATTTKMIDYFRVQLYPTGSEWGLQQTQLLIPLQDIAEIITVQRQDICPLPGVATGVLGVANQRGQLIWMVDLRLVQGDGMGEKWLNPQEKLTVVLLQQQQRMVGCLVSQLRGIMAVDLTLGQRIDRHWQRFYPFCDRQLVEEPQIHVLLNTMQLFDSLQTA